MFSFNFINYIPMWSPAIPLCLWLKFFLINWLLALAKSFGGIHLIAMGEVFYQPVSMVLCLQFHDNFASQCCHISLEWRLKKVMTL